MGRLNALSARFRSTFSLGNTVLVVKPLPYSWGNGKELGETYWVQGEERGS